jgi:RHS repeat-associated protein
MHYYPFGMMMPGRTFSAAGAYRYGFNGKEKHNEVKGEGNSLDFEERVYDSRLSRWLRVDLKADKYCSFTPYNFGINNP